MAPLTWRNVDAPNFSGVTQSLLASGNMMQQGASGISDAIQKFQANRRNAASSSAVMNALQYTDPGSYEQALRNGVATGAIDPSMLNPEALNFFANQGANLRKNVGLDLNNTGQGISNNTAQFNLDQGMKAATRQDGYIANQPAATAKMAEIRTLASSGNPADMAKARQMMVENAGLFSSAGMDTNQVLGYISGNTDSGNQGMQYQQNVAQNQDFFNERFKKEGTKGLLNHVVFNATSLDDARKILRNTEGLDAQTLKTLEADLQENKDTYFPAATPTSALPASTNQRFDFNAATNGNGRNPGTIVNNPLTALIDRTEGGGRYDTLYGHVQRQGNNPFSGVDVSKMTLGDLYQFSSSNGAYGRYQKQKLGYLATPMGRHQIVGQTLRQTAKEMGLPENTVFTPQVQDAMFEHIATKAISGPRTMQGKIEALRGQWEGFKHVSNGELAQAITAFESGDRSALTQMGNLQTGQVTGGYGAAPNAFTNAVSTVVPQSGPTIQAAAALGNTPIQVTPTQVPQIAADTPATPSSSGSETEATPTVRTPEQDGMTRVPNSNGLELYSMPGESGTFRPIGDGTYERLSPWGIPMEGGIYTPRRGETPASTVMPAPPPVPVERQLSVAQDMATIDSMGNLSGAIDRAIMERRWKDKSQAEIVAELRGNEKNPGPLHGISEGQLVGAIERIHKEAGISKDAAAIIAADTLTSRVDGSYWGLIPFNGVPYFDRPTSDKPRIDIDEAIRKATRYRDETTGNTNPGVNRTQVMRQQEQATQQVAALQQSAQAITQEIARLQAAIQANPNNAGAIQRLQAAQQQLAVIEQQLGAIMQTGTLTPYSAGNLPVR